MTSSSKSTVAMPNCGLINPAVSSNKNKHDIISIMKKHKNLISVLIVLIILGLGMFLGTQHIEVSKVIETGGILAIFAIVFAETGLLIGFFLPGDTLLFAAGFFAAQGRLSLGGAIAAVVLGAFFGNICGYEIGKRNGKRIFSKEDSILFHKKYIDSADAFYKKHGGKTILFARFVPVIRTLAPLMAGTAKMDYKKFLVNNALGAILWGASITLVGYWAGIVIGKYFNIDKYLFPVILVATVLTFGASFVHALREPETRKAIIAKMKSNIASFKNNKN